MRGQQFPNGNKSVAWAGGNNFSVETPHLIKGERNE